MKRGTKGIYRDLYSDLVKMVVKLSSIGECLSQMANHCIG
ncbi:unnamed protein product [Brugia timori]|uniref:Bm1327, isoform a n=2 Tax=Brugia TaxID=6278 RepID=A0A0J9XV86_BRUMA|nr:Bm1327, isoform a [Brugia malayi]VDO12237.1 unnamed protein product [Brugia timori]